MALSTEFGACDVARPDAERPSPIPNPMAGPGLTDLVRKTYFVGADMDSPLASPLRYDRLAEFPPTLVLTAEQDTLRHEMHDVADALTATGVAVTRREFAGVDHGFTHAKPFAVAREAIIMIGDLLRKAYA